MARPIVCVGQGAVAVGLHLRDYWRVVRLEGAVSGGRTMPRSPWITERGE